MNLSALFFFSLILAVLLIVLVSSSKSSPSTETRDLIVYYPKGEEQSQAFNSWASKVEQYSTDRFRPRSEQYLKITADGKMEHHMNGRKGLVEFTVDTRKLFNSKGEFITGSDFHDYGLKDLGPTETDPWVHRVIPMTLLPRSVYDLLIESKTVDVTDYYRTFPSDTECIQFYPGGSGGKMQYNPETHIAMVETGSDLSNVPGTTFNLSGGKSKGAKVSLTSKGRNISNGKARYSGQKVIANSVFLTALPLMVVSKGLLGSTLVDEMHVNTPITFDDAPESFDEPVTFYVNDSLDLAAALSREITPGSELIIHPHNNINPTDLQLLEGLIRERFDDRVFIDHSRVRDRMESMQHLHNFCVEKPMGHSFTTVEGESGFAIESSKLELMYDE